MSQTDAGKPPFAIGEILIYPGQGPMKFEGTEERQGTLFMRLQAIDGRMTVGVPMEKASELLRKPVSRAEAERLLGILRDRAGEPDNRHEAYRFRDGQKTLVKGSFEDQVRQLQRLYLTRFKVSFDERRLIFTYETATVAELAHVLGINNEALVDELHATSPGFADGAPERPPEPPLERPMPKSPIELSEHVYLGAFQVTGGRIAVGEWPQSERDQPADVAERNSFVAPARHGTWHAFQRGEYEANGLIAVHQGDVGELEKMMKEARELSLLVVEGGGMTMMDAAVRDDPAYIDEAMFPIFDSGLLHDRGCHCRTGGDGVFPLRGVTNGNGLVFVAVDFE